MWRFCLRDGCEQSTTGVAPETGFGGIGQTTVSRCHGLLQFDTPIIGLWRFGDATPAATWCWISTRPVCRQRPRCRYKVVAGQTDADEQARFAALWQGRVARMLMEHADDPNLVHVREWNAAAYAPPTAGLGAITRRFMRTLSARSS